MAAAPRSPKNVLPSNDKFISPACLPASPEEKALDLLKEPALLSVSPVSRLESSDTGDYPIWLLELDLMLSVRLLFFTL